MARKGSVIHNHIDNLNLEIDYDKLVQAIVRANKTTQSSKTKHMKVRGFLMGLCNGIVYLGLAYALINRIVQMWLDYIQLHSPNLLICIIATVFGSALVVLLYISQYETCNDTDGEVLNHFNSSVSFVALILALIAFLKG